MRWDRVNISFFTGGFVMLFILNAFLLCSLPYHLVSLSLE